MVWTFNTARDQWHAATPEQTCVQSNFYTLTDDDGQHDDRLEEWLSSVESNAVEGYERLLRGEPLAGEVRANFAYFAAILHVRTPAMIRNAAMVHGHGAAMIAQVIATDRDRFERVLKRYGPELNLDQKDKLWDHAKDPSNFFIEIDQHAGLGQLTAADKLAEIFVEMGWTIEQPDRELISCDNPIGRVYPPESYHPIYGDGGFMNRAVSVSLPLSPLRCLTMQWNRDAPGIFKANRERSMSLNRQRAFFADEQIFTSKEDGGIRSLGLKFKDQRPTMRIFGPPDLAKVEVRRKLQRD